MTQKDTASTMPTRKWEMDELLSSRLMKNMEFLIMLSEQSPLTRERYLWNDTGSRRRRVTGELEAELPWDFQGPGSQRAVGGDRRANNQRSSGIWSDINFHLVGVNSQQPLAPFQQILTHAIANDIRLVSFFLGT